MKLTLKNHDLTSSFISIQEYYTAGSSTSASVIVVRLKGSKIGLRKDVPPPILENFSLSELEYIPLAEQSEHGGHEVDNAKSMPQNFT